MQVIVGELARRQQEIEAAAHERSQFESKIKELEVIFLLFFRFIYELITFSRRICCSMAAKRSRKQKSFRKQSVESVRGFAKSKRCDNLIS